MRGAHTKCKKEGCITALFSSGILQPVFNGIEQAALLDDVLDKGREGLGLIGSAGGEIFNQAGIEIHP